MVEQIQVRPVKPGEFAGFGRNNLKYCMTTTNEPICISGDFEADRQFYFLKPITLSNLKILVEKLELAEKLERISYDKHSFPS